MLCCHQNVARRPDGKRPPLQNIAELTAGALALLQEAMSDAADEGMHGVDCCCQRPAQGFCRIATWMQPTSPPPSSWQRQHRIGGAACAWPRRCCLCTRHCAAPQAALQMKAPFPRLTTEVSSPTCRQVRAAALQSSYLEHAPWLPQTAQARQAARPLLSTTFLLTPTLIAGLLWSGRTRYAVSSSCSLLSSPSPPLHLAARQPWLLTSSSCH